ncbi:MAG: 3,4-dehydroadipyl-CoA semialdehyde dehydrogenase, partial [Hydrogenophaga sp.]|nr:3,4-dehydroadipyl-CoA semialdehyde dehydrogenase [Hydrogenophaga sp.]
GVRGPTPGRWPAFPPAGAAVQWGLATVSPLCGQGGPGRAGGGEELGGLRALSFYHRRSAVQGSTAALDVLAATATPLKY